MLPALNTISSEQAKPTQQTKNTCKRLLDYATVYPNAFIRYHATIMVLPYDLDAAYLVLPKVQSRIAEYHQLSSMTLYL